MLGDVDRDAFTFIVEHRVPALDWLFVGLSAAGQAGLLWIALAPVLAVWARRPVLFTTLVTAATVWSADLLALLLKGVFDRPRPYEAVAAADPLLRWDVGGSFPSGHAATSFAAVTILTCLLGRQALWLAVPAAAMGFARVYVGVHYPLDVVAGAVLGVAVGLAAATLVRRLRPTSAGPRRSGAAPPAG